MEASAVGEEIPADVMDCPGANKSTHWPQLENDARASIRFDAATVIALGALDGEYEHASALELPAATTMEMPSATARSMALFIDELNPPPILKLATAGIPAA